MALPDETRAADRPKGLSPDHQAELDRAMNMEAARVASHPFNRVKAAMTDLQTKRVDLHDRLDAVHRAVASFGQILLELIPPPKSTAEKADGEG